jgi:hypothetical protein
LTPGFQWWSNTSAGLSIARAGDVDGDGRDEILVGDWYYDGVYKDAGIVRVVDFDVVPLTEAVVAEGDAPGLKLGSLLAYLGDLDGDSFPEWALAATNGVTAPGHVRIVSSRTRQELRRISGSPATQFPGDLAVVGDRNGDGLPDLAVADPTWGSSDGMVAVFSAFGPGFVDYCTAGVSASGCQATLSASGTPSAFQPVPFVLTASGVEGDVLGLFFYGWNGRQANPWGNGTSFQCVAPPVKRAGLLAKTGSKGQCDGQFSQDLNAHWSGSLSKNPGPGAICQAQLWYRDPASTSNQTTSMSNAIEFYVDF